MPASPGRPRASSAEILESAAEELFIEQGYPNTTIDDIARRAGVGRNTFFNYFGSKSDLLWVAFDRRIAALGGELAAQPSDLAVTEALSRAIVAVAGSFGSDSVPWAIAHAELMGTGHEVGASGLSRFAEQAGVLQYFIATRTGVDPDDLIPRSLAFALLGAAAAAASEWIAAGISRRPLADYVAEAIHPVCRGFEPLISGIDLVQLEQ